MAPITLTSASGGWNCNILSPKLPFPMLLKVLSNRSLGASTLAETRRLHQPKSWLLHHKWVGCWFPSIAQDPTIPSCLQWSLTSWQKSHSKKVVKGGFIHVLPVMLYDMVTCFPQFRIRSFSLSPVKSPFMLVKSQFLSGKKKSSSDKARIL